MVYELTDEVVELLMAMNFDALIDGVLSLRIKRMRMTAKILDEWNTNEQDEKVDLPLKVMTFDASISFVFNLEKTKMRIGAHLADEPTEEMVLQVASPDALMNCLF